VKSSLVLAAVLGVAAVAAAEPPGKKAPEPKKTAPEQQGVRNKSTLVVEPAGNGFKQLTIENPLGDVRVEGYDGKAIEIETVKFAPDEDVLDRLGVSLVPNDGNVRIVTRADASREHRASRSQVRIDLTIRAPHNTRVAAVASAGKLEISNMDAGGDLDTGSGPISVRNVQGTVFTHSVSGSTSLAQVFGSVDAETLSANVDLDSINGDKLVASVNHGRIAGRRVRARDVELTTTEGKIMLEAETSLHGRLVVSSLRGDVEVKLRRTGPVLVRARGQKVSFGGMPATIAPDGWSEAAVGKIAANDKPAYVELRSGTGIVDLNFEFAVIPSSP
jgi:hypothetical protein